jgi:nucleoid-associated protein EbfC
MRLVSISDLFDRSRRSVVYISNRIKNVLDSRQKVKFDFSGHFRYIPRENRRKGTPMTGLPNMAGMMKQFQKMQEQMARVQEELAQKNVVGESGGGMVKVTANGRQQLIGIQIDKEVLNPAEVEMLEDLVLAAANKALEDAGKMAQEAMAKVTSGLLPNIPGLKIPGL